MTFETTVPIRYSDLDTYGHVNNAVYATLIEEARVDYMEAVLDDTDAEATVTGTESGPGIVLANLELSFERPLARTDAATVAIEVADLGESSITVDYEIRDGSGMVATAETTLVVIDRESGETRAIPAEWRERMAD